MLRHIVMIKFKGGSNNSFASIVSKELKVMLEDLELSIEPLILMEVGINISTMPSAYDIVLTADFEGVAGLDKYRVHPEHVKVLDYLKVVMEKAVVVDYIT